MKYLADTDVLIDYLKGKKPLDHVYISGGLGISTISYGELLYGAYKSPDKDRALHIITAALTDLSIQIIPLHDEIMHHFAKNKIYLERSGERLDDFDLLIASTALFYSLTLLTRNLKHFHRIPQLKIK